MKTKLLRKVLMGVSASALSCMMILSGVLPNFMADANQSENKEFEEIVNLTGSKEFDSSLKNMLNTSIVEKISDFVDPEHEISVMVAFDTETILDGYEALGETSMTVGDFAASREGNAISEKIVKQSRALQNVIKRSGLKYEIGASYDVLMSGFEIVIRAGDFETLQNVVGDSAGLFISEEYSVAGSELVTNDVDVYDTGIFDSSDSEYDGTGTIVAVLDTGLDYTHSAFSAEAPWFTAKDEDLALDMSKLASLMKSKSFRAEELTAGLTPADVYISRKVPYAYDYADHDPDVYPLNSDHGTHVAGIIAGHDETITGVAPNAQLAIMKVFSDSQTSSKDTWVIDALEDCVLLGVDAINMSLGAQGGFSREVDELAKIAVYDKIQATGISLVAAAGNEGASFRGSTKNGSYSLTTNLEYATVGRPATYDAALCVASVDGVRTPYILYGNEILYFIEVTGNSGKQRHFVEELLEKYNKKHGTNFDEKEFEFVTISGIGSDADYTALAGTLDDKIVLVRRGVSNFEDKIRIAEQSGAIAIIVYNNVSGEIAMSVGGTTFPACSLTKDDGMILTRAEHGNTITVGLTQTAGPFMSDFSSWGPTADLLIKPEITAHGGQILSSICGGGYERYSGTSMASPNQAGYMALVRQHVKKMFPEIKDDAVQVAAIANQLTMSTTDFVKGKNGLPASVRKQGAGLSNLKKATSTPALIRTYDRDTGALMDKTKLELGDDPQKTGVFEFKFEVYNFSGNKLEYDVTADVLSEGVATELTYRGALTVNQEAYRLEGAHVTVTGVTEGGSNNGNTITVNAKSTAIVSVSIALTEENKQYFETNFAYGGYVEGFVKLLSKGDACDLNVVFLGFYGDWMLAPLFDLDYFETNRDELDKIKSDEEKILPDAYATIPLGGLYDDYIVALGGFPYSTDPDTNTIVEAQRDKVALTNQNGEYGGVNSIYGIYCGLLRSAKAMVLTVEEADTGVEIYRFVNYNNYRSMGNGGGGFYPSVVEPDFKISDFDLKNNTKYNVKVKGYLDYNLKYDDDGYPILDEEGGGYNTNLKNSFEFYFYTDFEAPIATDIQYTYEYDKDSKTNRLYADISVYDNHYLMGYYASTLKDNPDYGTSESENFRYTSDGFSGYVTPVLGSRDTTSVVRIDLTDHLEDIKESHNNRSFIVQFMDSALNASMFEFNIPDDVQYINFNGMDRVENGELRLNVNETYRLVPSIYPNSQDNAWIETINYKTSNPDVVTVVRGQLLGVAPGTAIITATSNYNPRLEAKLNIRILSEGEEGYRKYDRPVVESFGINGYYVNKVYYMMSPDDRDLGVDKAYSDEGKQRFVSLDPNSLRYSRKMYPSESITLDVEVKGYYGDDNYRVTYSSSNSDLVEVTPNGTITAKGVISNGKVENTERMATITIGLEAKDASGNFTKTIYSKSLTITVKRPYNATNGYLMNYYGLGGVVEIPESLLVETIQPYAFSNSEYVPKDLSAGDVIDEYDKGTTKQWFIGDDTITEVHVSSTVKEIGNYAFANLTALKKVYLPASLLKIQKGAFYGCKNLEEIIFEGEDNLQFINKDAFKDCVNLKSYPFKSVIGIGASAFENTAITELELSKTTQSIAASAFANNKNLTKVTIGASSIKIAEKAFQNCAQITDISLNASVIPNGVFDGCTNLANVTLGQDVSVINQYAFKGTKVSNFNIDSKNTALKAGDGGKYILDSDDTTRLLLVAPATTKFEVNDNIKTVAIGAFSAATETLKEVKLPTVTVVEDYGFAECRALTSLQLGELESVGVYAFYNSGITTMPKLKKDVAIASYAFAGTAIENLTLTAGTKLDSYAFAYSPKLKSVKIEEGAVIGEYAFYGDYYLNSVEIGNNVTIGAYAFAGMPMDELVEIPEISVAMAKSPLGEIFGAYVKTGNSRAWATMVNDGGIEDRVNFMYKATISSISSIKIGNNVTIGESAFRGAGSATTNQEYTGITIGDTLTKVELGTDVTIGDYAFYGCRNLTTINLESVTRIGSYAFAGCEEEFLIFSDAQYKINDFITAAQLTSIDISKAEFIGEGAFENNVKLTSAKLPESLTVVPASLFNGCTALEKLENAPSFKVVGDNAFNGSKLKEVSLDSGAEIGNKAFMNSNDLATVTGLEYAVSIGDYAFYSTKLKDANLSTKKLGSFAFAGSSVETVSLGNNLVDLGENPFAGCRIEQFARLDGQRAVTTFDIADGTVKVIDGVLYRKNVKGLEIITYPILKTVKYGEVFKIASDTVRVGAQAFLNSGLAGVEIPRETTAIGDRAFYGCENLVAVVFRGLQAPRLEEQYDSIYETDWLWEYGITRDYADSVGRARIAFNNSDKEFILGLGLVDFNMWSVRPVNVLYGANFASKITDKHQNMIMVRPVNGSGYDTFTFKTYFSLILDGDAALSEQGIIVEKRIRALPPTGSLTAEDRDLVYEVYNLYLALSESDKACLQRSGDAATLNNAKSMVDFLVAGNDNQPIEGNEEGKNLTALWITLGVIGGIIVLAAIAVGVFFLLKKKGGDNAETSEAAEKEETSEAAEKEENSEAAENKNSQEEKSE